MLKGNKCGLTATSKSSARGLLLLRAQECCCYSTSPQPIRVQRGPCPAEKGEKRKRKRKMEVQRRGKGEGEEESGADIEWRLGTQGDFCSLKQLLEEAILLFCFLLTPFLLFALAKDMYKNVFWYVFSLGLYQNISFVSEHGTFFTSCLYKLVLLSDHVGDQRRHNLWTYLSQHFMLAWHVHFFTKRFFFSSVLIHAFWS